ncbi:hypothetical protein [Actinokineospora globicatena]|uniref:hypothetical protein n=1 Tax=Actinokineospora globicatena TaxID=103729 RepID=UPI0020A371B5|nr:hypothetical protein [Actinokineospora globicatena]MCP2301970.1 hypothetical protein [Actinokineospora globicatena]GLW76368.1 hypothetical protein Aglo01_08500 [Actinokineospora globicatena]GLW83204.1 hypothetical protein Aglo02_08440 [Actinokineospora globicatena]
MAPSDGQAEDSPPPDDDPRAGRSRAEVPGDPFPEDGTDPADDDNQGRHRAYRARVRRVRGAGAHALSSTARAADETDVLPVIGATVRVDRPATGLAKFDLGSIPASVTPPRSWRHAAWFAVTSAILVVIGLTYAAATLMSGPRRPDVVEALPGLPSQFPRPLTDGPSNLTATPDQQRETAAPTTTTADSPTPGPPAPPPTEQPSTAEGPGSSALAQSSSPTSRPGPFFRPEESPSAAPRSTVVTPMLVVPANDPVTMGDRTEAYYRRVVTDPDAAFAMTSGSLRRQGQEQIQRRYAGVSKVQVERIVIDPTRARTRSVLRVYRKDGSVTTEERELTFSYGEDPLITADKTAD